MVRQYNDGRKTVVNWNQYYRFDCGHIDIYIRFDVHVAFEATARTTRRTISFSLSTMIDCLGGNFSTWLALLLVVVLFLPTNQPTRQPFVWSQCSVDFSHHTTLPFGWVG
jgi:hypothetical protein